MYSKVEICGVDTSRLPVLRESEKLELLRRVRQGDRAARDALIQGNLRLVLSVVQRFANRGESMDDLFQVGCIGLMKAIDHFDADKMVRFSTYGVPMIAGEIRRFLRDSAPIRVSRSLRDTAYRALQAREALTAEQNREPTPEQIAQRLGCSRQEVVLALEAITDPVSLFEPVFTDSGDPLCVMDQVGSLEDDRDWLDEICIRDTIQSLEPRERRILSLRFLTGRTQMEVAKEIGISQAQVSRLEKAALDKLRQTGGPA